MMEKTLRCICGHILTSETIVAKPNSEYMELYCPNPRCRLGIIAVYRKKRNGKKLQLVKMIEEYNMLFMGTEDLQTTLKYLEGAITNRLANKLT